MRKPPSQTLETSRTTLLVNLWKQHRPTAIIELSAAQRQLLSPTFALELPGGQQSTIELETASAAQATINIRVGYDTQWKFEMAVLPLGCCTVGSEFDEMRCGLRNLCTLLPSDTPCCGTVHLVTEGFAVAFVHEAVEESRDSSEEDGVEQFQ